MKPTQPASDGQYLLDFDATASGKVGETTTTYTFKARGIVLAKSGAGLTGNGSVSYTLQVSDTTCLQSQSVRATLKIGGSELQNDDDLAALAKPGQIIFVVAVSGSTDFACAGIPISGSWGGNLQFNISKNGGSQTASNSFTIGPATVQWTGTASLAPKLL